MKKNENSEQKQKRVYKMFIKQTRVVGVNPQNATVITMSETIAPYEIQSKIESEIMQKSKIIENRSI